MAKGLIDDEDSILAANAVDLENGKKNGLSSGLLDRLMLNDDRICAMSEGMMEITHIEDPVGKTLERFDRPNGLKIKKVSVPMGVIGIIYEARPNVTADAAAICLKAGNAVVLRGGKEAINSNIAIANSMRNSLADAGFPEDCINLVTDTSRDSATQMMRANGLLDLLIPRGGAGLIKSVVENSSVPVIETGTGNCHIYIDEFANLERGQISFIMPRPSGYRFAMRPKVCLCTRRWQRNFCLKLRLCWTKRMLKSEAVKNAPIFWETALFPQPRRILQKNFSITLFRLRLLKI